MVFFKTGFLKKCEEECKTQSVGMECLTDIDLNFFKETTYTLQKEEWI